MNSLLRVIASFVIFALAGCGNANEMVYGGVDLVEKATADEDGWKGKEVCVSGYVRDATGSEGPDAYSLHLIAHRSSEIERHVTCKVSQGVLPEGIRTKTIVVKGKIGPVHKQNYLDLKSVVLDSCEIKK